MRLSVTALRMIVCVGILSTVTGCATASGDFCTRYTPVRTHDDTPESVQVQIDRNNARYLEDCL